MTEPHDPNPQLSPAQSTDSTAGTVLQSLRAGIGKLARLIGLATGLYVCVLVIGMISLSFEKPPRLRIDKAWIEGNRVMVRGRAYPGDMVEVLSGERQLAVARADWRGRFLASADTEEVPAARSRLSARILSRAKPFAEIDRTRPDPVPVSVPNLRIPPRPTLVYFIEELRILWIAGYGTPSDSLLVKSPAGGRIAYIKVGRYGCFDSMILIPEDQEPSAALILTVLRDGKEERWPGAFSVVRVKMEDLPLSRTAEMEMRREPRLVLRVRMPATHPYFSLLQRGVLPADEFGRSAFGSVGSSIGLKLTSLRKAGAEGTVEIEQSWSGVPPSLQWYGSGGDGMGAFPLLTAKDQITVRFHEIRPAWFDHPLPSLITENTAVWQGPRTGNVLAFGFRLPDLLRINDSLPQVGRADDVGGEKVLDFIRKISVGSAWLGLILLIPFAWLIWLGTLQPFGSPEIWRALSATAIVLALWRIFAGLAPWLTRMGDSLRALYPQLGRGLQLSDLVHQAFWMPFAILAAALPLLWNKLATRDPRFIPGDRWSTLRGAGFALRSVWFVAASLLYLGIVYRLFRPVEALGLPSLYDELVERLSPLLCICLILLAFGFRALFMGAGLLLVVLRDLLVVLRQRAGEEPVAVPELEAVADLPQGPVLLLAVLAACPFLLLLVRKLTDDFVESRRVRLLLNATLTASAVLLPHLPVRAILVLAGPLLLFAFGDIVLRLLLRSAPSKPWARHVESHRRAVRGALFLFALLLAWPLTDPATELDPWQLLLLNWRIEDLFVYVLALGLFLLLREHAQRSPSPVVDRATLGTGIYLFAALLINSYSLWLLLPVPFLVGLLLAGLWLFRPEQEVQRLRSIPSRKLNRKRWLIQDVVDSGTAGEQFSVIQKSLTQKLNSAELTPEEYEDKLKVYRGYLEKKLELEPVARDVRSREAVFAVGGPQLWDNVSAAVKTGAVLAAGPFLIALYQVLPHSRVSYPYPLVTLLVFILSAAASWLLYSFFFGFYFTYLRGRSGLTKGIHLFVALCLPFAVYRLLHAQSLTDMRPFLLWATQLFLFCSLLGLIAIDGRLLRSNGFRIRDLTAVHNLPALSAYASTAVAALVPTIVALITGKLGEGVKFFVETVLGFGS